MKNIKKYLSAILLSVSMLFASLAPAMQIQQFDKMSDRDQGDYIAQLVIGAQKLLKDQGQADLAEKVRSLFTTKDQGDQISIGMAEFELNLARARVADAKRIKNDPTARRLEVEDAMIVTLRKNGIELPPSFLTVASNFKPASSSSGGTARNRRNP